MAQVCGKPAPGGRRAVRDRGAEFGGGSARGGNLPHYKHVFSLVEENRGVSQILGDIATDSPIRTWTHHPAEVA